MSAIRRTAVLAALLATAPVALAQAPEYFPAEPAYRGEIKRGADGRLIAVPARKATLAPGTQQPATMRVGAAEKITTIGEAARLAHDGEVIEIDAGDYRGQTAVWTQDRLLIRGAGGRPVLHADGRNSEGRAIWVVRGGRVRIENVEFRGARSEYGDGNGIRVERGEIVVHRCAFFDTGILSKDSPETTLAVSDSEFSGAARQARAPQHLLAVGAIGRFVVSGSRFENGDRGDLLSSRARESLVQYNWFVDGGGLAAHAIDFPSGGIAYVIGNVIGNVSARGRETDTLVAYGADGQRWPDNALYLAHNTLLNDAHSGSYLKIWSEKFAPGFEAWLINNLTVGDGELTASAPGRLAGNRSAQRADLVDVSGLPLRPGIQSGLRGSVRPPGEARGIDLLPTAEFTFPVGSRPLHPLSALAPGAFQ